MIPEELDTNVSEEDIQVVEPVDVGDLGDVKRQRSLVPPNKGVKLRISKARAISSKDGNWRGIGLWLIITEGVEIDGEIKYKGSGVSKTITYYANPEVYTKQYFKSRQHLVDWKDLRDAVNLSEPLKVSDSTFEELPGQIIVGDIIQVDETRKDADGVRQKTGEIINDVMNIKCLSTDEAV